jgi:C-terminal processing protease CtpA/Prc
MIGLIVNICGHYIVQEPGDIGLGLVVLEDQARRVIQIKEIIPGMKVEVLAAEAKGSLKPGDILVAVAGVNVRNMPLSRGKAVHLILVTLFLCLFQLLKS